MFLKYSRIFNFFFIKQLFFAFFLLNFSFLFTSCNIFRVQLTEKYGSPLPLQVEIPAVYEMLQVACALSPVLQNDSNLINKNSNYYNEVIQNFEQYSEHKLVKKLEKKLKNDSYRNGQILLRLMSLNYRFNENNKIIKHQQYKFPFFINIIPLPFFNINTHKRLLQNFSEETNFPKFYEQHRPFYDSLVQQSFIFADYMKMKYWCEKNFDRKINSYRIVFSPLTSGFHNTMHWSNRSKKNSQAIMFLAPPMFPQEMRNKFSISILSGLYSRTVFTEINHNYVNPVSEKYIIKISNSFKNLEEWNVHEYFYNTAYETFNEYLTWAIFSLYVYEEFNSTDFRTINLITEKYMENKRKFVKFSEFNKFLLNLYLSQNQTKTIEEMYPEIIEWILKEK